MGVLLLSNIISASSIIVDPDAIVIDQFGGETVTEQITFTWTGETAVVGFIETEILPDGEGVTVTYSENPVILIPDVPKVIDMTIAVALNIMPGNYTIDTVVLTEIEEIIKYKTIHKTTYETIYRTIDIENLTRVNELITIIQQLQEKINQTTNCTDLSPLLVLLQDTFDELAITIEDVLDEEPKDMTKEYNWWLVPIILLVLINFVLIIIVAVYLHRKVRVLESQRTKEVEENENKNK
jgi:hypothetical protein